MSINHGRPSNQLHPTITQNAPNYYRATDFNAFSDTTRLDPSDVQEVRARLLRRDGGVWPPQADILHRMEREILSNTMTAPQFKATAAMALDLPQALSETFRQRER